MASQINHDHPSDVNRLRSNVEMFRGGFKSRKWNICSITSITGPFVERKTSKPHLFLGFCSDRWISEVCDAFSKISVIFAANGPGPLPENQDQQVERAYLQYRSSYNSALVIC